MLGGGGGCGGPVSWWCSEAWRCSPKVAPNTSSRATSTTQMADCDQCSAKFSLLKRRRLCGFCGLFFCGACIKRGIGGLRICNKCLVLTRWPLDISEVTALRVKDLRQFLHSQHINTAACTEKRDLIDLVTRHISNQHRRTGSVTRRSTTINGGNSTANAPVQTNYKPVVHSTTTRDDGIRVRPSSTTGNDADSMGSIRIRPVDSIRVRPSSTTGNDANSMGSIRVRAVDSIRVRPSQPLSPDSSDYDPETDLGIRVFASERQADSQLRASSTSPISAEGYSESADEDCSRCQSEDCTTSCCSLESCHNGASSHPMTCTLNPDTSRQDSFEDVNASGVGHMPDTMMMEGSGEWIVIGPQGEPLPINEAEVSRERSNSFNDPARGNPMVTTADAMSSSPLVSPPDEELHPVTATSSSASSSTPASAASSPEPSKSVGHSIIPLGDLKSEEDIHRLSVRQCKEILALHRVSYSGVREKSELLNKIELLWRDYQNSRQDVDGLPEELVCKICMDSVIDCVLLECGHMVACTQCGKQMSECPVCRQYVVRVVRTFRA
ncbi:uncharacterized protein [Panulirus ornatus]|uniref:uncharacterized protein n=1 Tax=Panulirus ornatus TaxID=150431 RepID=UPI003A866717